MKNKIIAWWKIVSPTEIRTWNLLVPWQSLRPHSHDGNLITSRLFKKMKHYRFLPFCIILTLFTRVHGFEDQMWHGVLCSCSEGPIQGGAWGCLRLSDQLGLLFWLKFRKPSCGLGQKRRPSWSLRQRHPQAPPWIGPSEHEQRTPCHIWASNPWTLVNRVHMIQNGGNL